MTDAIETAIFDLLAALPVGKSVSPEEVAKAVDAEGWRRKLGQVRGVAVGLARQGKLVITRHNKPADPDKFKGVYRLRLPEPDAEADPSGALAISRRYRIGGYPMAHLPSQSEVLLKRVRRIAGQVEAIERSIAGDADCATTLHLVAAARGAINGLLDEIVEAHIREHVAKPGLADADRARGADEVVEAVRRYSK